MAGSREVMLSCSTGQYRRARTGAGDVQIVSWALSQEMKKEQEKNILWLEIAYTDFLMKAVHIVKEKSPVSLENKGV